MARKGKTTPTDRIALALIQRGYRTLATYEVQDRVVHSFRLYTSGQHVLCMQVYKDGGCELYHTVSDDLGVDTIIDAIP